MFFYVLLELKTFVNNRTDKKTEDFIALMKQSVVIVQNFPDI